MRRAALSVIAVILISSTLLGAVTVASAYTPSTGDTFNYSETIVVNNGQGSYTGYSDQTQVTGAEHVTSVKGANITATFNYSYQFSNNQGSSTASSKSGTYTWSTNTYTYLNGTDNQVGYSKPIYLWFAMNPSLPVGATFFSLNTQFTVLSKNYSFQLSTEGGQYIQTIQAKGTGEYQRNDEYGVFTASYTWYEYFDPQTGYVVGYSYVEQDTGEYQGQTGSFTYTDNLGVTSTSYPLTLGTAPPTSASEDVTSFLEDNWPVPALLVFIVIVLVGVAARRRRKGTLPKHSPPPPSTSSAEPWASKIDLGAKPSEQVVIREVAKVNCKYCGTLIPTTVDRCPYCGGPRQ